MYPNRELTFGFEWEPADEHLEGLLTRVSDESRPYHGQHAHHEAVETDDAVEPVGTETDDDQA